MLITYQVVMASYPIGNDQPDAVGAAAVFRPLRHTDSGQWLNDNLLGGTECGSGNRASDGLDRHGETPPLGDRRAVGLPRHF